MVTSCFVEHFCLSSAWTTVKSGLVERDLTAPFADVPSRGGAGTAE